MMNEANDIQHLINVLNRILSSANVLSVRRSKELSSFKSSELNVESKKVFSYLAL
jgi:hypothetical protein